MQIIKTLWVFAFLLLFICNTYSQSVYIPVNSWEYHLLDRLDIKNIDSGAVSIYSTKPTTRKLAVDYVYKLDSQSRIKRLNEYNDVTSIDLYNMDKLLMTSTDYLSKSTSKYNSKQNLLNRFWLNKANFYEVNTKDFQLVLNPLIQQTQGYEMVQKKHVYLNSKGLELRGMINKKIGFYAMLTDNQENGPNYYRNRVDSLQAVPGNAFYKRFKPVGGTDKGQDYFDYRGYITFKAAKSVEIQYGYDKNFIGNGYRSLFLSDVAAPTLFLKLNTKIWKLNYQNLFMELTPTFTNATGGSLNGKKYAAMHHLGINVTNNFTLGLFESVIFERKDKFDFSYLVPVIFYRAVESGLGSSDNAVLGADFKINFAQQFQVYGQVLLDEFKLSYFKDKNWGLKIGGQAGLKYIDVAGIPNLDAQIEWNIVRPYTYTHFDSATTYTHYNQPLAHPLGANFSDFIFITKYQASNKLNFEGKVFVMQQGQDSSLNQNKTFGGNIFSLYQRRTGDINQLLFQGVKAKTLLVTMAAAYEIRPNLYLDASLLYRKFNKINANLNTMQLSAGVRWNMNRRLQEY